MHTPGKWHWQDGWLMAGDKYVLSFCSGEHARYLGGSESDKALIAAAPAMLEALRAFVKRYESVSADFAQVLDAMFADEIDQMYAAIAAAEPQEG